ncbi:hypothetical protein ACFQ4O_00710 [Methylopila musalis]|uniref:Uncharacterized protein n=1 Tax=Methylopila musalis TaxID=1134781 RepID=A0ABW3Z2Y9_9HYPH
MTDAQDRKAARLAAAQAAADALGARVEAKAAASRVSREQAEAQRQQAARKLRRAMEDRPSHRNAQDRGAPGTRRQGQDSGLQSMSSRGLIWGEVAEAAAEIEAVFHMQTAGLMCRAADYSATPGRSMASRVDRHAMAYARRYKPWADELSAAWKAGGKPALAIVIALVIDDMTLRQAEQDFRMRRTTIQHIVRRSLLRYAEMMHRVPEGSVAALDRQHPEEARAAGVRRATEVACSGSCRPLKTSSRSASGG